MKTILALVAVCLPITAQTLSITPAGQARLWPVPEHGATLFTSDSPRAKNWEFLTRFAAVATVPTNKTKFYRAVVNAPPLKLLAITETNQTIRGSIDKNFESLLLVANGVTNRGWSYGSQMRHGTNGPKMPVATRWDFTFRHIQVSNSTQALLIITDEDGSVFQTNLFIGPGPYVPLLPKRYQQPAGLSPAAAVDPQSQLVWGLTSHSSQQEFEVPDSEYESCAKSIYSFSGNWDGSASRLQIERKVCKRGNLDVCRASYSANTGVMFLDSFDGCQFSERRLYMAVSETGSYSSDRDDDQISTRLEYSAFSTGDMWIGGRLLGSGVSNYWVRISIGLETVFERTSSEFMWWPASSVLVNSIGGMKTKQHVLLLQVPPEGLYLDCTPGFGKMDAGLFRWWPGYLLASAED